MQHVYVLHLRPCTTSHFNHCVRFSTVRSGRLEESARDRRSDSREQHGCVAGPPHHPTYPSSPTCFLPRSPCNLAGLSIILHGITRQFLPLAQRSPPFSIFFSLLRFPLPRSVFPPLFPPSLHPRVKSLFSVDTVRTHHDTVSVVCFDASRVSLPRVEGVTDVVMA